MIKTTAGYLALTLECERQELASVGQPRITYTQLKYNGIQRFSDTVSIKLYTILTDLFILDKKTGNLFNYRYSTRSIDGLIELGVIKHG